MLQYHVNTLTSTAINSKSICSWGTLVTTPTHHVGFTAALTSDLIALTAEGALGVTLAGWMRQI